MASAASKDYAIGIDSTEEFADRRRTRLADALVRTGGEDREAFREVYTLTSAKLFGICLLICGERAAAEDVLQDVYLKVWRYAGAWEPGRASPITWLGTIARNQAIDWKRKQQIGRDASIDDASEIADPLPRAEAVLLSVELSRQVQQCLSSLDPRTRDAIGAAYFYGMTYAELAERSAIPLGTMKSRVRRGLAKISAGIGARERAGLAVAKFGPGMECG